MKTLLVVLVALLVVIGVYADSLKMTWKQPSVDNSSMKEWQVFYGNTPNPTQLFLTIPYSSGQSSYQISQTIPPPIGTPGTKVKYYFSIAAVSKNGFIGSKVPGKTAAGLDYIELTVAYQNVGDPYEVIIELIIAPTTSSEIPAPDSKAVKVLKGLPK